MCEPRGVDTLAAGDPIHAADDTEVPATFRPGLRKDFGRFPAYGVPRHGNFRQRTGRVAHELAGEIVGDAT